MRPVAGVTFGGRYELSSRIAVGGMGEVWKASDSIIGRSVAIKILKDEYMGDPGFLERFRAEARHAALVNHEGIANVFDYGEEQGSAYIVMELVPGEPLSAIIEREGRLPSDRVLGIVAQTATALQAAHDAGLVHRDIKPGNLLITPEGRVKITDFGIARIADQVPLTATGQVMGTVQYLAPEQASGHTATPSTDIYSLGIVAYECLAGKRPFTGESQVAIAMAQINDAPPALPDDVPQPVQRLVLACLAKDPQGRPASAAKLAQAAAALHRGNVALAASYVPMIAGAAAAATTVMPATAGGDAATTMMPQTTALPGTAQLAAPVEETEVEPAKKKRSPWTWPLIPLIALIVLVGIGTAIALTSNQGKEPVKSSTNNTDTPKTSEPPKATAGPVDLNAYKGVDYQTVVQRLSDAGFTDVTPQAGDPAADDQSNLVYDINPTGSMVNFSTPITVYYHVPFGALERPAQANSDTRTLTSGGQVTVRWDTPSCPVGLTLQSYNLSYDDPSGAIADAPASVQAGTNTATITAKELQPGTPASQIIVRYTFVCGNATVTREPQASPA
ncbi:MAG: protein kinase, partial [Actinobacteria bacterium]|nr:protein kinase [Actinomycetota bacterium]